MSPVSRISFSYKWGVYGFGDFGLIDVSGVSQVVDISQSEIELWRGLSDLAKRSIKTARRKGYLARTVKWNEWVDCYYTLHQQTYHRTNVTPHPKEYFSGIADHITPLGYSTLTAVFSQQGAAVAFHNTASFHEGAYYHTGCSNPDFMSDGINYLAFWQAMVSSKARGCRWYDCGAIFSDGLASEKQKGLTMFKTKFGGEPHRLFAADIELAIPSSSISINDKPKSSMAHLTRKVLAKIRSALTRANSVDLKVV
jgi:hypothetical protein